jgi:hypothetical protein
LNGSVCRFTYKGKEYKGKIIGNQLIVEGIGGFKSFSGASKTITKTSRVGWNDWDILNIGSSNLDKSS